MSQIDKGGRVTIYTVRSGDTLRGIAQNVYGDASLWWRIAAENGLASDSITDKVGSQLRLPALTVAGFG